MKLYFSSETSGNVVLNKMGFLLNHILYKIEPYIIDNYYGEEIEGVTAIPIIVDERFNIPERRYISRKSKLSDVRLRIDYNSFSLGDFDKCCQLLLENCIASFAYVNDKSTKRKDGDFHLYYEKFIDDFTRIYWELANKISQQDKVNFGSKQM